ncbi:hypothetical protein J4G48_0003475 [Bradyrhizobium barranii subsp. apii]|uniref:hypothetical protein n=1 Tax=Bradyrhizobium barranii TaxID=2992140 RepID=UPI001AA19CBE|nr:hypothetical protein [Bradyrhizobium barranii]UPT97256.1 hypothetical protein J4G48_0003475 [Bradyrhizobium barranii subsp. apii]
MPTCEPIPSDLLLDTTFAMLKHDIDHDGAIELAGIILARHGGADVAPEELPALLDDLVDHGFLVIPDPDVARQFEERSR